MNHDAFRENIFLMEDEELSAPEREALRAHVAGCPECRQSYEVWRTEGRSLFRTETPGDTERFTARVMARLEGEPRRPLSLLPRLAGFGWGIPAFAAGLAALLVFWLGGREAAVSLEESLLVEKSDLPSRWLLQTDSPKNDELLSYFLEDA